MKISLFYLSLLSVTSAFCSLTYTTPSHAKAIQPTTHVGTWQNKDEDGDGVPDEVYIDLQLSLNFLKLSHLG